ncbi:MAG: fibronectin type III domain-containing protein [Bacteroidota bacterium]|nr:fibronectin type III domain-containing protein [Bacteroidota bacterium]
MKHKLFGILQIVLLFNILHIAKSQSSISGITITNLNATDISVSWDPLIYPVSIIGYNVQVYGIETSFADTIFYDFGTKYNYLTITGLMANTSYNIRIGGVTVSGYLSSIVQRAEGRYFYKNLWYKNDIAITNSNFSTLPMIDSIRPTAPGNFTNYSIINSQTINPYMSSVVIQLDYIKSFDNFGVKDYIVYLNDAIEFENPKVGNGQLKDTITLFQPIESTLKFSMHARDFNNNVSTISAPVFSYIPDIYAPYVSHIFEHSFNKRDTSLVIGINNLFDVSMPITFDLYVENTLYKKYIIADTSFSSNFYGGCWKLDYPEMYYKTISGVNLNPIYACDYLFTINGLNPRTEYNIQYNATDAKGNSTGIKSARWPFRTGGVIDTIKPSRPLNVIILTITSEMAIVAWDPSTDNVRVKEYEIEVLEDGTFFTISGLSATITGLTPGNTYNIDVRAIDSNKNKSDLGVVAVTIPFPDKPTPTVTGIQMSKNENSLIYPNPATNKLNIKNHIIGDNLIIKNIFGEIILIQILKSEFEEIDISNIPKGIYFIQLGNNNTIKKLAFK